METDAGSFEAMYAQTANRVMAYCLRHAGPHAAEDAVAETFAIAWRRRSQIPDPPLPWLIVTARNTLANQRRQQSRQHDIADRIAPLTALASAAPDRGVHRAELLDALGQLSPDDREALLLVAWDGLSTRDAARVLGVTPGALRVRVHRARARLRASNLQGACHD